MSNATGLEKTLQEFIKTFSGSLDPRMWFNLIKEEHDELLEELYKEPIDKVKLLKEFTDLLYVTQGFMLVIPNNSETLFPEEEMEEMTGMLDFAYSTALKANAMFSQEVKAEALRRVHKSNMSKLGDDGKPIRREDGKILKGPNYKLAILDDLIEE